jgi:hypothetical protein
MGTRIAFGVLLALLLIACVGWYRPYAELDSMRGDMAVA